MKGNRHIPHYAPAADFAQKWPDWEMQMTPLHGLDEVFDSTRRIILIDPKDDGEDWAVAHATAHLDLEHHLTTEGVPFSMQQEVDADDLAELRTTGFPTPQRVPDEYDGWPAVDGEPTVSL